MTTTVYRAYDESDGLLYVGSTSNVQKRKQQHKAKSEWYELAARWTYEDHADHDSGLAAEAKAIRIEHPAYNRSGTYHRASECGRAECGQAEAEAKARAEQKIQELLAAAPPLSAEQVERIRALLPAPSDG